MPSPNVTVIPATLDIHAKTPLDALRKKRVAGYARVSSGSEEQESSFEAQVDYYTKRFRRTRTGNLSAFTPTRQSVA